MRLTTFTDYALRVLMYLGTQPSNDRLTTIGDIAAAYGISENHLMKVVHRLAQEGYIETIRGKDGGICLARAPGQINIGAVVRATEEDMALVECLQESDARCPIVAGCVLRGVLGRALDAFLQVLDAHTLADLLGNRPQLTVMPNRGQHQKSKQPPLKG